ncbi:hypothetical protein SAMN05192589_112153 [Paracidovorax valerianellae]|uniref:Uncharacterized protein n=1 Tax=Paracidovorax valerianellae TaxID=187868 RepID=A0A1G7AGX7_9BURK|nr:hypothetical protein [Paracidovorax valerianellae]SDE13305.1 hypothetical protein SAMN05192589_112153 [Paracidovorax valerianellae]
MTIDKSSITLSNQLFPAVVRRFKGVQGSMPWRESYADSPLTSEIASTSLRMPSAVGAIAGPAVAAAQQAAVPMQQITAGAAAQAADAVRWNLSALQSRSQTSEPASALGEHAVSQAASVQSVRPYAYADELSLATAQGSTLLQATKPLEWTAAQDGLESTRPYAVDAGELENPEHTKPLLLSDLADGWETTKPSPLSPSMVGSLGQSASLLLEGSAQQLLQAMAGFAPSAMGVAAAVPDQVSRWRQEIAVGLQS